MTQPDDEARRMALARQRADLHLGSLEQPPEFAPAGTHPQTDIPKRLAAIDWFAACGQPSSTDFRIATTRVYSWDAAFMSLSSQAWDDTTLTARNALTMWLFKHAPADYQGWNDHVDRFKTTVLPTVTSRVLAAVQQRHDRRDIVRHSVQWDLVNTNSENAYIPSGHRVFFFLELLAVYEAGHLPCGWAGSWPEGSLIVL